MIQAQCSRHWQISWQSLTSKRSRKIRDFSVSSSEILRSSLRRYLRSITQWVTKLTRSMFSSEVMRTRSSSQTASSIQCLSQTWHIIISSLNTFLQVSRDAESWKSILHSFSRKCRRQAMLHFSLRSQACSRLL